ncbi:diamine N-acetyltransferase [Pseudoduganella flava]|uniref:Diamine N-acetyltransferase n=1 Tax=Pseudoduganella flava TaxID=871742 RepID=A0A562PW93_9BURK|nr:GNAT family N-acetyltransferase [Pseudoduganella flava]QGZ39472.1 GNAT family N-acetyltransferase [Pseudoduganella flava]TWI48356.1 diamine N-acetyltransferase [Pseudoduganella flava]
MPITLRPITRQNFDAVTDLELLDHQRAWVASNSYSIAQASFYPNMRARAIYAGDELVGFVMDVALEEFGDPGEYGIWRLMVDRRHQGKGYGRAALDIVLDELRARPDARKIWISYKPDNRQAQALYASLGFVETGFDEEDGETQAVLTLPAA